MRARRSLCPLLAAISIGAAAADSGSRIVRAGGGEGGPGAAGAALVAALAAAEPGDTIVLAAGDYEISSALRPKSGVRLLGAGQDRTTLRYRGKQPGSFAALDGVEDIEIAGMTLDGEGSPLVHQGITGRDSRRLLVRDVTVRNLAKSAAFGPHGILWSGTGPNREKGVADSAIRRCTFEDIGIGAEFGCAVRLAWGSSRNTVEDCVVRRTGRGGIFGDNGSRDLVIRGNRVEGSGGEGLGIEVWGGCDGAVIEDNRVDHWLSIGGCDRCAVRRNVVADSSGAVKFIGIEVIGSDCVIAGNTVDDGQMIGISVSGTTRKQNVLYARNDVRRCIQWGAQLQGETSGLARHYFHACRFADQTLGRGTPRYPGDEGHGFRINDHARGLVLEDCEFAGNGRLGIQSLGGDVGALELIRCRIRGNGGAAAAGLERVSPLEWRECSVEGNGNDRLPAAQPFARAAPSVAIEAPANAAAGQAVAFRARVEAAAGGAIGALLWDLGDGPPETAAEVTHVYSRPGRHRVTLVAWDDQDRGARAEHEIEIGGAAGEPAVRPLPNAHSHNDYEQPRPLLDALDRGFCSVEADVFLAGGELLVAHTVAGLRPGRTLESLYLAPLAQRARENGGRVHRGGPAVTLLVDFKTEGAALYTALRPVLRKYGDILTSFAGGKVAERAVTVILSGNRPVEVLAAESERLAFIDGRLPDLESGAPAALIPLVSANFAQTFKWRGQGDMPAAELDALAALARRAHDQGRRLRFWSIPDTPAGWKAMQSAGVDLINTDKLDALEKFLCETPQAGGERAEKGGERGGGKGD